jgi:hypothetical protein
MDKSELETIIRFAHKNNIMNKPFVFVYKWYKLMNML